MSGRSMNDGDAVRMADEFDLARLPPGFVDDPYPVYRALRTFRAVKWLDDGGCLLTRHADCDFVYRHPDSFSSDKQVEFRPKFGDSPLYAHHTTSLVFNDPPRHTRVRTLIMGALTPRHISAMQPGLERLVTGLLDELCDRGAGDLVEDFAAAIPIGIIGNLLGVPQADRGPLRGWSQAILGALEPVVGEAELKRGNEAVADFSTYLDGLIDDRRRRPLNPEVDVMTRLIQGENGEVLDHAELVHNCIFLLNAGHETTTNLIGNALVLFDRWPEQRRRLLAEPGLMKHAVEECLRFESPNQLGNRLVVSDTPVGGELLPAGTRVTLCIGAANRDPDVFDNAEVFDVRRRRNRHLAFAAGIHACAGMNLARLEASVALRSFFGRCPHWRLGGPPVRSTRVRFRGLVSIPACAG